jgi:aspartate oxidase
MAERNSQLLQVTLLGGHSVPRTRTNPVGGNVGWSIMAKVIQAVKALPGVTLLEGTKASEQPLGPLPTDI